MEAMADTQVDTMLATVEVTTTGNAVSLVNVVFHQNVKAFWFKLLNTEPYI